MASATSTPCSSPAPEQCPTARRAPAARGSPLDHPPGDRVEQVGQLGYALAPDGVPQQRDRDGGRRVGRGRASRRRRASPRPANRARRQADQRAGEHVVAGRGQAGAAAEQAADRRVDRLPDRERLDESATAARPAASSGSATRPVSHRTAPASVRRRRPRRGRAAGAGATSGSPGTAPPPTISMPPPTVAIVPAAGSRGGRLSRPAPTRRGPGPPSAVTRQTSVCGFVVKRRDTAAGRWRRPPSACRGGPTRASSTAADAATGYGRATAPPPSPPLHRCDRWTHRTRAPRVSAWRQLPTIRVHLRRSLRADQQTQRRSLRADHQTQRRSLRAESAAGCASASKPRRLYGPHVRQVLEAPCLAKARVLAGRAAWTASSPGSTSWRSRTSCRG